MSARAVLEIRRSSAKIGEVINQHTEDEHGHGPFDYWGWWADRHPVDMRDDIQRIAKTENKSTNYLILRLIQDGLGKTYPIRPSGRPVPKFVVGSIVHYVLCPIDGSRKDVEGQHRPAIVLYQWDVGSGYGQEPTDLVVFCFGARDRDDQKISFLASEICQDEENKLPNSCHWPEPE